MGEYSIQVASKLSGVGTHTLRAWEKRYKAVVPKRNPSGRRVYSDEDVEKLSLLSELCLLGCSIGTIAHHPIPELKTMLEKLGKNDVLKSTHRYKEEKDKIFIDQSLNGLLLALEGYKLDIISHELKKLYLTLTPRQLALEVLVPLVYEVGRRILKGKLSLSQEHALNSVFKFHLGHYIYQNFETKHKKPQNIIIAGPEGDYNEVGIMLAALLTGHYRINYFYLGANTPADSIIEAAKALDATHFILINSTGPMGPNIEVLSEYLGYLSKKLKSDRTIFVSGFHRMPQMGQNLKPFQNLNELDHWLKEI